MLVDDNLSAKQLAKQHKGGVFQESFAVTSDSQITQVVMMSKELPKGQKQGSCKPERL
jgi:hypothetical protein